MESVPTLGSKPWNTASAQTHGQRTISMPVGTSFVTSELPIYSLRTSVYTIVSIPSSSTARRPTKGPLQYFCPVAANAPNLRRH